MDNIYFKSILVRPPQFLGRQLRHFSCYHALVLLQFDSPFLIPGTADLTRDDILFAAWVCTTTFQNGPPRLMSADRLQVELVQWAEEIGEFDLEEAAADFVTYRSDYVDFPKIWDKVGDRKESRIVWCFKMVATILASYKAFREAEAWDLPLCRVACYRAHVAEFHGADLVTAAAAEVARKQVEYKKEHGLLEDDPDGS